MAVDPTDDFYVQWYSAKLWGMLPAIYRTSDAATTAASPGPLQELVARIATQAALLRRSIDRLWENQSIETCDDWVIPYIGALLDTRLVACLAAPGQRVDVAKTIHYRRRAGTLGLIEELVSDIARHDARAVEFFRRLGRTRHSYDPPLYPVANLSAFASPAALLAGQQPPSVVEGLYGPYSRTPAGGFADLRQAYAASNTGTAFDEYAYTADVRAGGQSTGWYNIPQLGIFVWWLYPFTITGGTPVASSTVPGLYSFDPTGRDIPLYAPSSRTEEDYADTWVSPDEWKLPVAVRSTLWNLLPDALYPDAFAISLGGLPATRDHFTIDPPRGRFQLLGAAQGPIAVTYRFGFSSTIGAGGFDPGVIAAPLATPAATLTISGGAGLDTALAGLAADTTLLFADSATYAGPLADPGATAQPPANIALVATGGARPVLRWTTPGASWTVTGSNGGTLLLQGLWLQGADLVIAGTWDAVALAICTIDPGTRGATAIDGLPLAPSHIVVSGTVGVLSLDHCITGPIRTAEGGAIAALSATDSIVQCLPGDPAAAHALLATSGAATLTRTTVLGALQLHRLSASECILDEVATVDDPQDGCVRYCTLAAGHNLRAPYRCATVPPRGPIFRSRDFGDPDYARLRPDADQAIPPGGTAMPPPSVLGGAQNGAEPGAFAAEAQALTLAGLAQKFAEYAPIGLNPVWVSADP
jgi:hypothetical protein